jgi:hypothetical protein
VNTGSNQKFSSGWDRIFSGKKSAKTPAAKAPATTEKQKKPPKK